MHHTGSKSNIFCHFSVKNDKNRAQNTPKMASRFSSWKKTYQNWALSVSFLTPGVTFLTPKCSFLTPYHAILTPFFHVGEAPFSCKNTPCTPCHIPFTALATPLPPPHHRLQKTLKRPPNLKLSLKFLLYLLQRPFLDQLPSYPYSC